ncbi:uncharacterized protein [Clytia hemisphaerica]|uniref:uncharacterized protein n=1 Tax=Clytia hemisphaerica TaxID=252671 RepID=UPI0034D64BC9
MYEDYVKFMNDIISKGYATKADKPPADSKTWYILHHGVYHPKKPDKIRVVFDCSMKANGYCLNQEQLQKPDLTSQLMGVLVRFREEPVAVMGDIEAMFCQVRVPDDQRDYLHFLWWPDGDLESKLQEYQMCVHYFGITSSPSCVNHALRRTATENKFKYGEQAAEVLHRNFYVDDMLKSFPEDDSAISTVNNTRLMCKEGGFCLTKFHWNSRSAIKSIPSEERSKSLKDLDMTTDTIPNERALDMQWCPERDVFAYKVQFKEKPSTRRGVLSTVSSMYDPLGLISPFLLEGKKIIQEICANKHGWDEPLTEQQFQTGKSQKAIIRLVQQKAFPDDINQLKKKEPLKKTSPIYQLAPFFDGEDILRVGGRINNATNIPYEEKHPIVLPRPSTTTKSVIQKVHEEMRHGGRNATLCTLREKGFWCINGNSLVRHVLHQCVSCRKLRGKSQSPKMADLPPFTYVELDLFGPFLVKERRSELKRYGIIYTCLNSRACHPESVNSMDTDSFIMCIRRFIARREPVQLVRCDNGSNFVGARTEFVKAINEVDDQAIKIYLMEHNADFVCWKFNPPYASNFGGVWERLIRSTRAILDTLLTTHGHSLNDEPFRTLLVEIEVQDH